MRRRRGWLAAALVMPWLLLLLAQGLLRSGALTPTLDAAIERALGRPVSLGAVSLRLWRPAIEVEGLRIANPEGFARADFLRAERVALRFGLSALLRGEVTIHEAEIAGAELVAERSAAGEANWRFMGTGTSGTRATVEHLRIVGSRLVAGGEVIGLEDVRIGLTEGGSRTLLGEVRWRDHLARVEIEVADVLALAIRGRITTGPADLSGWWSSLRLRAAELQLDGPEAPLRLIAEGARHGEALRLVATLPAPRDWLLSEPGPEGPRFAGTLEASHGRLTAEGSLASGSLLPLDLALAAPDLAALSPLVGVGLPALRPVAARARLQSGEAGGWRLTDLAVSTDAAEVRGVLDVSPATRPILRGRLSARRLDLDAIAGPGLDAAPAPDGRVIPATPLPVQGLAAFDAGLDITLDRVRLGGVELRDIATTLRLEDGRLLLDPLRLGLPGGVLQGRVALDGASTPPILEAALRSAPPGLDLVALRRGAGIGGGLEGLGELAFDVRGEGADLRALAATLSGRAGLAMVGGRFTPARSQRLGPDLVGALLPPAARRDGLALRCFALRLDARQGLAASEALHIDGASGRIDGRVAINLRDETLAARLLPDVTVLGVTVRAPVTIGGTLAAPRVGVEAGAAMAQVLTDTVANRLWRNATVEWIRGTGGAAPPSDCPTALRLARLGQAGAAPPPSPAFVPLVPRELQGAARDVGGAVGGLLRGAGSLLPGRR